MTPSRIDGRVEQWNDARGFGFVRTGTGERVFLHASAVETGYSRPVDGDVISFEQRTDAAGRAQAARARTVREFRSGSRGRSSPERRRGRSRVNRAGVAVLTPVAVAPIGALLALGYPLWVPALVAAMGVLTFLAYGADKRAAVAHRRRVPESTLQGLAALGGWPGALLAQQVFRHKTRKTSFQLVFSFAVLVNIGALVLYGLALVRG